MSSEEVLWVEKYRPTRIDDIIDQDHVKARVKEMLANGNIPHLLFFGPPGTGKTTMLLPLPMSFMAMPGVRIPWN